MPASSMRKIKGSYPTPIARTAYRDSFPVLDTSDLPPPQPRSGLLRDRVTNMREACLRNGVSMLGVIG